ALRPRRSQVADRPDAVDLRRHARVRHGPGLDRAQARGTGDDARSGPKAARPHTDPARTARSRLTDGAGTSSKRRPAPDGTGGPDRPPERSQTNRGGQAMTDPARPKPRQNKLPRD